MGFIWINVTLRILEIVIMHVEIGTRFSDAIRRYIMTIEATHAPSNTPCIYVSFACYSNRVLRISRNTPYSFVTKISIPLYILDAQACYAASGSKWLSV